MIEGDRQFHDLFLLDCEAGVGDGETPSPTVTLRWSDDGGHTWSNERSVSIGAQGAYGTRAVWRRMGQARDRIYEVSGTDPVKIALIDAHIQVREGRH